MDNTTKEILEFLKLSGRSASEITSGLKSIGKGSMEAGLSVICDYVKNENSKDNKKDNVTFAIASSIATAGFITICAFVKKKIDERKKNKEEREAILDSLKVAVDEYSKENNLLSDDRLSDSEEQHKDFQGDTL